MPFGCSGSIPARAGEPPSPTGVNSPSRVYPRACGGTQSGPVPVLTIRGLSPRVRGNPEPRIWKASTTGSIPARAGEP